MFPNSLLQVEKLITKIYKLKTLKTFVIYFHLFFSKGKYCLQSRGHLLFIPMGEMDFCLLLLCAVLLVTVLFLFQNQQ